MAMAVKVGINGQWRYARSFRNAARQLALHVLSHLIAKLLTEGLG